MPQRCRVLVVDDDVEWLELVGEILRSAGYCVATATDGRRGAEMIADLNPFVVMTDLQMPRMSGRQLLTETNASDGRLPVIVLSGDVTETAATLPEAFRVILKPATPEGILAAVEDAVAHRVERLPLQKLWRTAPAPAVVIKPTAVIKPAAVFSARVSAAISYVRSMPPRLFVLVAAVLASTLVIRNLTKA